MKGYVDPLKTNRTVSDGGVQAPMISNNTFGILHESATNIADRYMKAQAQIKANYLETYKINYEMANLEHRKRMEADKEYKYDTENHKKVMEELNEMEDNFLTSWREEGYDVQEIKKELFELSKTRESTDLIFKSSYMKKIEEDSKNDFFRNSLSTRESSRNFMAYGDREKGIHLFKTYISNLETGVKEGYIKGDQAFTMALSARNDLVESGAEALLNSYGNLSFVDKMKAMETAMTWTPEQFDSYFAGADFEVGGQKIAFNTDDRNKFSSVIRSGMAAERSKESVRLEKQALKSQLDQQRIFDNVNIAIESKDPYKLASTLDKRKFTSRELLDNPDLQQRYYGKTIAQFGDPNDTSVGILLNSESLGNIREEIRDLKGDGLNNSEIAQQVIYPFAEEMAGGDEVKKIAILKQLGVEISGYNSMVLMKGETDSRYFKVYDEIKVGRGAIIDNMSFTVHKFRNKQDSPYERYNALINSLGGDNPLNKQQLDNYLNGLVKKTNDLAIMEAYKVSPNTAINNFLKNDDYFEEALSSIKVVKDLMGATRYKKANLNDEFITQSVTTQILTPTISTVDTGDTGADDMYDF